MIEINEYKERILAMLFVWGDPLEIGEMARVLDLSTRDVNNLIGLLEEDLEKWPFGLEIRRMGKSCQLQTKDRVKDSIEKLVERTPSPNLGRASLEVLTIVAYLQPITRIEIEELRGVSSASSLQTLLKRGLIEEAGRLDRIGKPILYRTTDKFLASFQLDRLEDLPKLEEKGQNETE